MSSRPTADSLLAEVLAPELADRVLAPLGEMGVATAEDLYECVANVGGNWYKGFTGIGREDAVALVDWLTLQADELGEVTPRFYPSGTPQSQTEDDSDPDCALVAGGGIDALTLPPDLDGSCGTNRGTDNQLDAYHDLDAVRLWLKARAVNPNTLAQYKKEAERFVLWSTMERGKPLSSLTPSDALLYPTWLEELGRTESDVWAKSWRLPQSTWIGPKNAPRMSAQWRPFNGPLSISSRKTALTVVRILFAFLVKTAYLRFNPFDQVTSKVRYLPGEGAPKAFADRSLTERQWDEVLAHLESLKDNEASRRMRVILSLGKGLGLRASEMVHARVGWIAVRRIGDEDLTVLEIVGKGDKVRRLPLSAETLEAINDYLAVRGESDILRAAPSVPLLTNLGVGRRGSKTGLSRSGLYKALVAFFEGAAEKAMERSAADAAKLRAGTTHWLRHTFATTALKSMDINIVQNAMGHASIGTTSRYLTPEEAQIADAMKKMKPI